MGLIDTSSWAPAGIAGLEPAADHAVRSTFNTVVTAGPGAGKTELLAQRACYLLQTNECPAPKRILAISFKRDAAQNLKDRVRQRCGDDLSRRFKSQTYDSFAKQLLDRFRLGLPIEFQPTADYSIGNIDIKEVQRFLLALQDTSCKFSKREIDTIGPQLLLNREFLGCRLQTATLAQSGIREWAARRLWHYYLRESDPSLLSFKMISRLTEAILRINRPLLRALRATYSHVFLDEFQDTTDAQYDLVSTAFSGSKSIVTAVGDQKQRIMGWAGALDGIFERFRNDFSANEIELVMNYRSSPGLVSIQGNIVRSIEAGTTIPQASDRGRDDPGRCMTLRFSSHAREGSMIASAIKKYIDNGIPPREICILTKIRPDSYASHVIHALAILGVNARIELDYQELLAEPVVEITNSFLRWAWERKNSDARDRVIRSLCLLRDIDFESASSHHFDSDLKDFRRSLKRLLQSHCRNKDDVKTIVITVIQNIGEVSMRYEYPQYRDSSYYNAIIEKYSTLLYSSYASNPNWTDALNDLEGTFSVPVMTIHKSKGLEFHTVFLIGLEDSAFFSYANQRQEDLCTIFVALSRAKQRMLFSRCDSRITHRSPNPIPQSTKSIQEIYELLWAAGVEDVDCK